MTEHPGTEPRQHSAQCFTIGGGPGHQECVCYCHGTTRDYREHLVPITDHAYVGWAVQLLAEALGDRDGDLLWTAHKYPDPAKPYEGISLTNVGLARELLRRSPRLAAALARSGDLSKLNAALEKAWAERPDLRIGPIEHALSGAPLVHAESLPERVVVGANGAYWRDFGTHYSMCPVSTDNDPVVPLAVYVHAEEDRTGGLDAAWAAAEAALPDGWRIEQVRRSPFDFWKWLAYANGRHESDIATGSGLTPAAALRGLAAALSATPTDEAERE